MNLTPAEEEQIFNAVYQDRVTFLKNYPKCMEVLEEWASHARNQKPLSDNHALSLRATAQAYEDEIKRQKTLKLISQ